MTPNSERPDTPSAENRAGESAATDERSSLSRRAMTTGLFGLVPLPASGYLNRSTGVDPDSDDSSSEDGDREVIEYDELSDRGQRFVDEARGIAGHSIRWIGPDDDRTYIQRDPETGDWVRDDDPLTLNSVDEELREVIGGHTRLSIDGRYYEMEFAEGHEPYAWEFAAERAVDCVTVVATAELSNVERDIANTLATQETAWIVDSAFKAITDVDADAYHDSWADIETLVEIAIDDDRCLGDGCHGSRIKLESRRFINTINYHLRVATANR